AKRSPTGVSAPTSSPSCATPARSSSRVRKRDTAWFVALGAGLLSVLALLRRRVRASAFFALGAGVASRRWSRDDKAPFPYSLRWILDFPHPISPDLLRRGVEPSEGDHVLGIGPGTGRHAVLVARWVAPTGTLDVFDVQQEAAPRRARSGSCSAMARRSPTWRSSRPPDRPVSGELLDAEGSRLLDDDHAVALPEGSHRLSRA